MRGELGIGKIIGIVAAAFAAGLAILLTSQKTQSPRLRNIPIYRKAVYLVPDRLDPAHFLSTAEHSIAGLMFDGLFTVNNFLEIEPSLVESWAVSEDGKQYRFSVKQNARFHNGQPLLAQDVASSLQRLVSENGPVKAAYARIAKIEVVDSSTIVVELTSWYPTFISLLAAPFAKIIKFLPGTQYPIGTGPFMFEAIILNKTGRVLKLQRFNEYHGKLPQIEKMEVLELSEAEQSSWPGLERFMTQSIGNPRRDNAQMQMHAYRLNRQRPLRGWCHSIQ